MFLDICGVRREKFLLASTDTALAASSAVAGAIGLRHTCLLIRSTPKTALLVL